MGRLIALVVGLVLVVVAGILVFSGDIGDLTRNNNNTDIADDENLTGTGGPDEGVDPLESGIYEEDGSDNINLEEFEEKG